MYGATVGVCPGAGLEGWLRSVSPTPLVVLSAGGQAPYPAFAPCSSTLIQLGFLWFLYLFVHFLPQLCMHTVIFSPLQFPCVLLSDVSIAARQQRVPGPRLSKEEHQKSTTGPGWGEGPCPLSPVNSIDCKAGRNASLCPMCTFSPPRKPFPSTHSGCAAFRNFFKSDQSLSRV